MAASVDIIYTWRFYQIGDHSIDMAFSQSPMSHKYGDPYW